MRALQELVQRRLRELGESTRVAAARSRGLTTAATLSRLSVGKSTGKLRERTVTGLALALKVTEAEIWAAADADARPLRLMELSEDLADLPPAKLDEIISLLEGILEAHNRDEGDLKGNRPSE